MRLLCVYPSEEDGCMQLFTDGIRKIIVRLVMVVIFAFSVRVVLMKSTEDEGTSPIPTVKSSIVNGDSDTLNYLMIIVAMGWLPEKF